MNVEGLFAAEVAEPERLTWAQLPTEVLMMIFRHLSRSDLLAACSVCFHWATSARVPSLWYGVLCRQWPDAYKLKKRGMAAGWMEVVRFADAVDRNWASSAFVTRRVASQAKGVIDFLVCGREVVTCGLQKTIVVTNVRSQGRTELPGHEHHVCALTEVVSGTLMAACSYDSTVSLWGMRDWKRVTLLAGHTGPVLDCKVFNSQQLLSRGGRDGSLRLWDTESGQCVSLLKAHSQSVTGLKIVGRSTVLSCSRDGSVKVWDVRSAGGGTKPIAVSQHHTADAYALHLPKGSSHVVYSCSADSTVVGYDYVQQKLISRVATPQVPYVVKTSHSGRVLAGGGGGALLSMAPFRDDAPVCLPHHEGVMSCLRVVNRRLVSGGLDGGVAVWEQGAEEGRFAVSLSLPRCHGPDIVRKVRADHLGFFSAGYDGCVAEVDFQGAPQKEDDKSSGCIVA
jgi:hypothetical protein